MGASLTTSFASAMGGWAVTLQGVLEAGLTRAGTATLRSKHLTGEELEELLLSSHSDFLWPRSVVDHARGIDGWGYYTSGSPGLRRWWGQQAHLTEVDALRLRHLRREVYNLLEQRGLIRRAADGSNPPLHVARPVGVTVAARRVG